MQANLFYSFGRNLMSLMLLNVFVLRKFLCFFELVNFLYFFSFFSVSTNQHFFLIEYKLILWPIVLTEGFLAFGTTNFHTKFSDFCA